MDILSYIMGRSSAKGGGSGDYSDVHFVTFMSEDGTVELYKRPVADGDDCADPVERGLIEEPTKESTAQYNYTHVGWSASPNGALDENILKAITADKTVYANFAGVIRYYTVRFYDGETLLSTQSVAYGAIPTIANPTKDGYSFDSWNPSIVAVTGDANYYAQWVEKVTFAGGSWQDIIEIADAGEAKSYFAVGETKVITVSETNVTLRIIGFNHDDLFDGSGKAGMTIFAETPLPETTAGGHFAVRNFLETTIKNQLPSELQAAIRSVTKEYDSTTQNTVETPSTTRFDLFPLSYDEMKIEAFGTRRATDSTWRNYVTKLGSPYEYFENIYSSTYFGPGYSYPLGIVDTWLRQYFRYGTPIYMAGYRQFSSSIKSYHYSQTYENTEQKKVCFAFCIGKEGA